MLMLFRNSRLWMYYTFMTLCFGVSNVALADSGPSEKGLKTLYTKRIAEDNRASEMFFGKQGSTKVHGLKKVSCNSIGKKASTQSCNVVVEITSYGLGRHEVKDQVVVRQNNRGRWIMISDVFN